MSEDVCNMAELRHELEADEGCLRMRYLCPAGKWTVGIGHNLEGKRFRPETWAAIRAEWPHVANALLDDVVRLSDGLIDRILRDDVSDAVTDLDALWIGWRALSERRKRALINLSFQLGQDRFRAFRRFWAAMRAHQFDEAAHELRDSLWYHQTQASRTERVIRFMREG